MRSGHNCNRLRRRWWQPRHLQRQCRGLRRTDPHASTGGEPPDNGGMEITERVIRVEEKLSGIDKRLDLVEKDLRDLSKKMDAHFYWVLAAFAGMAVLMAKGFKWF